MKKILVVEDTQVIREEIRDILIMENFKVFEAANGFDGIEATNREMPDLIISDISMPKVNGYEFLIELRKHSKTQNIPVIFLSAKAELSDIRKGMNLGADDYLTKPLRPDDLIIAVNKKLELKWKNDDKFKQLKSQITQYLPHELITPLNGILGLSEYLKEDIVISKDELNHIACSIYNCGQRLYRLIENYLMYSSLVLEANSINDKREINDIDILETHDIIKLIAADIVKERFDDLLLQVENVNFKFSKYFYKKMVEELLNNAIKFTSKGSRIFLSSIIRKDKYILQITNFGTGISAEQIDEIGAFIQFNRKIIEQQGMGLGLEIVKLIAESNGGTITIESKLDEYFKVMVQFPIL